MSIYRVLDWMRFFEQEFGMGIADFFNAAYPITKLFNQVMERIKSKIFELNFFFFFRNKIVVLNFLGLRIPFFLSGFGQEVPVSAFLPESTTLAKLLNEEVKHTSASIFVTASMDPEKVDLYLNQVFSFHITFIMYMVHLNF